MILLREKDKQAIVALACQHLPAETEIWAYGSRVTGEAHDMSDLDLVVRYQAGMAPVPWESFEAFRDALRDSTIPIIVQVLDWARIPNSFHQNILRRYEVIWDGKQVA